VIECHEKWGNRWARIAPLLPGRTANAVKNRWNSALKRHFAPLAPIAALSTRQPKPRRPRAPLPLPPPPPVAAPPVKPAPEAASAPWQSSPALFDGYSPFDMAEPAGPAFDDGTPFEAVFGVFQF
jgi:hypothetical protein